jgi:hypothetical protein
VCGPPARSEVGPTKSLEDAHPLRVSPFTEADREAFLAAYDGEIAHVDRSIGRLLEAVPEGRRARLLVVVAGDHGEAFGEHLYFFDHGEFLGSSAVDVPLLVHGPSVASRGRVEDSPVRLLDSPRRFSRRPAFESPPASRGRASFRPRAVRSRRAPRSARRASRGTSSRRTATRINSRLNRFGMSDGS